MEQSIIKLAKTLEHLNIRTLGVDFIEFQIKNKILSILPNKGEWYYAIKTLDNKVICKKYNFRTLEDVVESLENECII